MHPVLSYDLAQAGSPAWGAGSGAMRWPVPPARRTSRLRAGAHS